MDYRSPAGYDRTRNAVIGHKVVGSLGGVGT